MKINTVEHLYHTNLVDASLLLSSNEEELVSLKIRPIDILPQNDDDEFWDAYVYNNEYKSIYGFLSVRNSLIKEGSVNYGNAKVYSTETSEKYIFVEHETGPEIIANLALITASLALAKSVVDLIKTIIDTVNKSNEKKKKGEDSDRYYETKAITIEKRTQNETRILKIIQYPSKGYDFSVSELRKLLDD